MSSEPELVYVNEVNDPALRVQDFNGNWKFILDDPAGAEAQQFDDSSWQNVNLPHDYSIDQEYTTSGEAESGYKLGGVGWYRKTFKVGKELSGKSVRLDFDGVYMDSTVYVNGEKVGNHPYGYSPFSFDITGHLKMGEQNTIAVRVNHQTPSSRWYSGSGIGRDVDLVVTDPVHVDKDGVIVTTPGLKSAGQANVKTHIKTTVANSGDAEVKVKVVQTVFPRGGEPDAKIAEATSGETTIAAGKTATVELDAVTTEAPELWDTVNPALYTVRTQVMQGDKVLDAVDVEFGYRFFSFDADTGFSLNGRNVKLKGVCMHHDQGSLGAVASRDAIERQVKILKEMGCNSIRATHNPHSRELTEICNEQGILLISEMFDGWTSPKNSNSNDYSRFFDKQMGESELIGGDPSKTWAQFDLERSVLRDINAPSVIMWSLGNEMTEGTVWGISNFKAVQKNLINWAKAVDPTRPITTGDNKMKDRNDVLNPSGIAEAGGIVGFNYMAAGRYQELHKKHPDWKIYGSETASAVNSRGVYDIKGSQSLNGDKLLTSYDKSAVNWGATASQAWYDTVTNDFIAGEYVWTGFDYLGEPTPKNGMTPGASGSWPSPKNSYFGIIDTAGLPKDSYYLYQAQWNDQVNTLHILPAWNEDAVMTSGSDKKVEVVVYTDAPQMELFFTPSGGKEARSLGKKHMTEVKTPAGHTYYINKGEDGAASAGHTDLYLTWEVPYADGTISAKVYDKAGRELDQAKFDGRKSVTTAGPAAQLSVTADRKQMTANGTDLAYLTIDVKDQNGNIVPTAKNKVTVKVEGAGVLAGMDNGVQADHQSYRDDNRAAQAGQLIGIVRAGKNAGDIKVTVSAEGLKPATITIPVAAGEAGPSQQKQVDGLFYSRYHYIKTGGALVLPERVEVRYTDGSRGEKPVAWEGLGAEQLAKPGTHTVKGMVDGAEISAVVTVIEEVAALKNYSTTIPVGGDPVLPKSLPAIMPDGTVMNVSFPVTWKTPEASGYDEPGIVVVEGGASVFGVDMPVQASVRVQKGNVTIGSSVSGAALHLVASPAGNDTLDAVKDGKTALSANSFGGANKTCWSNYDAAQEGNTKASLTFDYATQQTIGQINVFFGKDGNSGRWPDANTTTVEVSETGADDSWREVKVHETIAENDDGSNVKKYTYDFEPTNATFIRINVQSKNEQLGGTKKPCVMITEIELLGASTTYPVGAEAKLASLNINGKELSQDIIDSGSYKTRAIVADVKAAGKDNAAVTVLPAHDGKIKILIESEDHAQQGVFTIALGAEATDSELSPDDESRDYPVDKITATGGDPQGGNPLSNAFDKNPDTHYHSRWSGTVTEETFNEIFVDMELAEPVTIEALRYLPRGGTGDGDFNGTITSAKVLWSEDGQTWHEAGAAEWADHTDKDWKILSFDKPITAKYFRLDPVSTYANSGNNKYVSAAEIRLRTARTRIDIADDSKVTIDIPKTVEVDRVDAGHPVLADALDEKVTCGDKTLIYGVDYLMHFKDNTSAGTATVTFEGIDDYGGTAERTFEIKLAPARVTGIAVKTQPAKVTYTLGEAFDPAGLVLQVTMSDGTVFDVALDDGTAEDFTFTPAAGSKLEQLGSVEVTVRYKDHESVFTVSVQQEAKPDPEPSPDPEPQPNPDGGGAGSQGGDTGSQGGSSGNQGGDGGIQGDGTGNQGGDGGKPGATLPTTGDRADDLLVVGCAGVAVLGLGLVASRRQKSH